jgi:glutamate racemase
LVEAGLVDSDEMLAAARTYGGEILRERAEAVILGCTHYPFLRGILSEVLGSGVMLLDPAEEVAEQVVQILEPSCVAAMTGCTEGIRPEVGILPGARKFFVSGDAELFWQVGSVLMGEGFCRGEIEGGHRF